MGGGSLAEIEGLHGYACAIHSNFGFRGLSI